ncbi:MAG: pantoate--beta-alanine ligase [Candidatus Firestonebacteria bacterium]|nr:pantoate--beta-alanine ligase [Candidatus Firestonebacteria bacterium]
MRAIKSIAEMQFYAKKIRGEKKSIGFVPTMGYFHDGHLSLMHEARLKNDISVVSIFVNPAQFGKNEDFSIYPRDIERDSRMAMDAGIDILFIPSNEEIYPQGFDTYIDCGNIGNILCGASRPGHFRGVSTIVTKLFNIVKPDRAYFGQKDFQQSVIIKKLTQDLNMDIEIVVLPVIREKDGLAMSSRNIFLSPEERKNAAILFKSLQDAKDIILSGERNPDNVITQIKNKIEEVQKIKIDYVCIVDKNTLQNKSVLEGVFIIVIAVFIGTIRLIDNIEIQIT